MRSAIHVTLILVLSMALGCGDGASRTAKKSSDEGKTAPEAAKMEKPEAKESEAKKPEAEKPEEKKPVVVIPKSAKRPDDDDPAPQVEMKTSLGTITLELNRTKAPITVKNFLQYVEDKHFDGTIFHRVMKTFMIQGGGFDADKKRKSLRDPIKLESQNGLSNFRGTIAMARTGIPDSATAQFFINVVDNGYRLDYQPGRLDGYAVFGKVTQGMDVVDKIRDTPIAPQGGAFANCPVKNVIIESVRRL